MYVLFQHNYNSQGEKINDFVTESNQNKGTKKKGLIFFLTFPEHIHLIILWL